MCGIIGYKGSKNVKNVILGGLKRLEYRGYDSAGLAYLSGNTIKVVKEVGKISNLENKLKNTKIDSNIGIGHTRWATHGQPSEKNSHPHFDCKKEIALVHNGIIENYKELRDSLVKRGHKFVSETDTEVLVHLIEENFDNDLKNAVANSLNKIVGTYGICVISSKEPETMVAARKGSPLILGIGEDDFFVTSDVSAILSHTKRVVYLEDGELAVIKNNNVEVTDCDDNSMVKEVSHIDWDLDSVEKGGYDHFMLKEIHEQPEALENTLRGRITKEGLVHLGGLNIANDFFRNMEKITIVGCGTSWHAGLVGEYLFENLARVSCEVEYASEFRYRDPVINDKTLVIVISQSGETADTLSALREAKVKGATTVGIVNVVGSTIAREVDGGIYTHAGLEIGVASTKAFTTQVSALVLLAAHIARVRGMSQTLTKNIISDLLAISGKINKIFAQEDSIKIIAKKYHKFNDFLYLGRWINFPIALEGALKLKEISYIHAEGFPSAEMKHGPIALVDRKTPAVFVIPDDELYEKGISNLEETRARKGMIISIATEGNLEISKISDEVVYIPKTNDFLNPILANIPLQLLAYYVALERGCDVDKPRNLAKSVTVE